MIYLTDVSKRFNSSSCNFNVSLCNRCESTVWGEGGTYSRQSNLTFMRCGILCAPSDLRTQSRPCVKKPTWSGVCNNEVRWQLKFTSGQSHWEGEGWGGGGSSLQVWFNQISITTVSSLCEKAGHETSLQRKTVKLYHDSSLNFSHNQTCTTWTRWEEWAHKYSVNHSG